MFLHSLTVPAIQSNLSKEQTVSKPKYVHFLTRSKSLACEFAVETLGNGDFTGGHSALLAPFHEAIRHRCRCEREVLA